MLPASRCQRVGHQFGPQVIGGCPADHAPGGDVDDCGQIEPALVGRDVCDVAAPTGIEPGAVGLEVPDDEVGTEGGRGIGDRGRMPSSAVPALQPSGSHQSCDTTTAAPGTLALEHGMHARAL